MPVQCRQHWELMRTARRKEFNPAYRTHIDDGSDRYIVATCNIRDDAVIADEDAHTRQIVRDILRGRPAFPYQSKKNYSMGLSLKIELLDQTWTLMSSAAAQSSSLPLLATNNFTTTIFLIGFWQQCRLSTSSMDGWSSRSCSTSGHLRVVSATTTSTWRLCGVASATAIGQIKH
eukprot:6911149-Pyramimonas_sp.AAC.1